MVLRILQMDLNNEKTHGIIYRDYDWIKDDFDINLYSVVYEDNNFNHINPLTNGPVEEGINDLLEYVFRIFNIGNKPENYHGHSLSVSDIVEIDGVKYYVDGFGFVKIS